MSARWRRRIGGDPLDILKTSSLSPLAVWPMTERTGAYAYNASGTRAPTDNLYGAPERLFAGDSSLIGWQLAGATVTDAFANNRNGVAVASRFVAAASANGYLHQTVNLPAGTYTMSIDMASNTGLAQNVRMGNNTSAAISGTLVVPATGWVRQSFTFTTVGGNTQLLAVYQIAAGDALDLLIYGAKINAGSSVTPYVAPDSWDLQLGSQAGAAGTTTPIWITQGLAFQGTKTGFAQAETNRSTSQVSLYTVARYTGTPVLATYGPLISEAFDAAAANRLWMSAHEGGFWGAFGATDSTVGYGVKATDAAWHVFAMTYDGLAIRHWIDDTLMVETAAVGIAAITLRRLYMANFVNAAFWPGDIGAGAVYLTGHTAAQVATVGTAMRALVAARGVAMTPLAKYVAIEGDSISTGTSQGRWIGLVMQASTKGAQGRIFAIGGSTIANLNSRAASVDASYSATRSKNVLHVLIGANDLLSYATAALYVADLKTYWLARRTAGFKVVAATILPRSDATFNTRRNAANILIRAESASYDALSDFAADATMGTDAAGSNVTYYGDGLHPTAAGHAILAPIGQAAIDSLL